MVNELFFGFTWKHVKRWSQHCPRPEWYAVGWLMSWFSWLLLGMTSCALQPVVCFLIWYRLCCFFLCGFVLIQKPWWVHNASIDFHTRGHQTWGFIWPSGLMPMNRRVTTWQMLMLQFSVFTAMLVKSLGIFSLFPWFLFNQSLLIGWIRIPSWLLLFLNTLSCAMYWGHYEPGLLGSSPSSESMCVLSTSSAGCGGGWVAMAGQTQIPCT